MRTPSSACRCASIPHSGRCGYLFLAHSGHTLRRLQANVALQNGLEVPSQIVSPAEAAELVPGLDASGVVGGAWCGEDGYFDNPQAVLEAFGALADVELAEVADLDELAADAVVVAAGVDTPRLLPELPIRAEPRFLFFSDPIRERLLEPLVVSAEAGLRGEAARRRPLLASDLRAGSRANVRTGFEELLPRLVYVALPTLVEGLYDVTPDQQPILGQVRERVWVAAGFSGRGFMQAPAIGRIVAESVLGAGSDPASRRASTQIVSPRVAWCPSRASSSLSPRLSGRCPQAPSI